MVSIVKYGTTMNFRPNVYLNKNQADCAVTLPLRFLSATSPTSKSVLLKLTLLHMFMTLLHMFMQKCQLQQHRFARR